MTRSASILVPLLASLSVCTGNDLVPLYDTQTLAYWRGRYQRSTTKILDDVIWPVLLESEKRSFGYRKPVIDFPLPPEATQANGHPLAFYSFGDRSQIVFPALSLKFLDDLCTAYAWLQLNGYGLETISEYTAILRYGRPPATGFPAPLPALHIPASALDSTEVNQLALGHFVTARTFILLHEMGHILQSRSNSVSANSIANEQKADAFAAAVMKRTPLRPLGMLVFFLADAHWTSYPPSPNDTHPLSGTRVMTLANQVDDPVLALKLNAFGRDFLDNPLVRQGFAASGQAGNLDALAPRRPGELPRLPPGSSSVVGAAAFDGLYRGQLVQSSDPDPMPVEVLLHRNGDTVTGRFTFGLGTGTLSGTVVGDRLSFEWQWGNNFGKGQFQAQAKNGFTGAWGYKLLSSGAGTWTGTRPNR